MRIIYFVVVLILASHSALFALAQTTSDNYVIEQPSFSGGAGTTDSDNYSTRGTVGQSGSVGLQSDNYSLDATEQAGRQADVLPKPTLINDNNYFDRLRIIIDKQYNAPDTVYAIAISKDNFATFSYVQKDLTIGSALGQEDWLTYAELGENTGELIRGLAENTTYKVKVASSQGNFSDTRYSAISDSASTGLSFLRLSADTNSCPLGTITPTQTASCSYILSFSTNNFSGLNISTKGPTLTMGGNKIQAIGETATVSKVATEQFGLNAKTDNNITILAPFNSKDQFAFSENIEQPTISTDIITDNSSATISAIANVSTETEPGNYTTTLTHTIYAN